MQHVDPDMNELFKKAADEYPLQTDTSDWEAMLGKLDGIASGNEAIQKRTVAYKKLVIGLFSLLLLLPVGLMLKEHFTAQQQVHINSTLTSKENTESEKKS